MGTARGLAAINYVGDIAKFYDNILLEHVAAAAQKLDFPAGPLWFGVLVHRAARVLRHPESLSGFLE
eukprot:11043-Lingulodinium_polyedra.AAC.1